VSAAGEVAPPGPRVDDEGEGQRGLDLPGVLPLVLVAATWELLLLRIIGLAAGAVRGGELADVLGALRRTGSFVESFTLLLCLALAASLVVSLVRRPAFGPLPHRVTVAGFGLVMVALGAANLVVTLGPDTALLAHSATVLLATLVILGLSWHAVDRRLLVGAVLLLLPTLLRFYASCALSIPLLRTSSDLPLHAFRAGEVAAVLAALASPWLLARLSPRALLRRPPLVALGLASMPAIALGTAIAFHEPRVRDICLQSLGFELILPPAVVVYPLALFCFFLAVSLLVLPGAGPLRSLADQRIGYGLALLFVAGLDGLHGTVLGLDAEVGDVPELIRFLLEGHWEHLALGNQALVGPPLRDTYQLVVLGLGYLLIGRGVAGQLNETPGRGAPLRPGDERDPS
jgi:hypothetical protein